MHLSEEKLEATKKDIKIMISCSSNINQVSPDATSASDDLNLYPTSKLRKQFAARKGPSLFQSQTSQNTHPVDKELSRYEMFSLAPPTVDILDWWKKRESTLPLLSRLVKTVLTIPCSSAKSERVFSCAGNFATPKRNRLALKKIEDLVIIKQNRNKLMSIKSNISDTISKVSRNSFNDITIEAVTSSDTRNSDHDLDHAFICNNDEDFVDDSDLESDEDNNVEIV